MGRPDRWTADEFWVSPDDGTERELLAGEIRSRPASFRTPDHSEALTRIGAVLRAWRLERPRPRGRVLGFGAPFCLRRNPDTLLLADVGYAPPELDARTPRDAPFYDGPPALAVEILSPTDTHGDVVEKVHLYLEVGTVVWVVDPDFRTVTVHRPGERALPLSEAEELVGDPYLPGFRARVAEFFED